MASHFRKVQGNWVAAPLWGCKFPSWMGWAFPAPKLHNPHWTNSRYLKHVCLPYAKLVLQASSAFLLLSVTPSSPLCSISPPNPTGNHSVLCAPLPSHDPALIQCFTLASHLAHQASQLPPSHLIFTLLPEKKSFNSKKKKLKVITDKLKPRTLQPGHLKLPTSMCQLPLEPVIMASPDHPRPFRTRAPHALTLRRGL